MSPVLAVAGRQLRRRRVATLLLLLLVGVAASAPMALWAAGRRTSTAFDAFLEQADTADVSLYVCPPGYDPAVNPDPTPCFTYDAGRELEIVRSLPHVEQAAPYAFRTLVGGLSSDRESWQPLTLVDLGEGASVPTFVGSPIVLSGRLAAADAPDEVMIREGLAGAFDVEPGDRLWIAAEEPADAPPVVATVAGVIRTPLDLLPITSEADSGPPVIAREGWVEAHGDLPGFGALAVWLDDDDVGGFMRRVRERLPDQAVRSDDVVPAGEVDTIQQAIDYESGAATAAAAVAAVAAAFFLGQAVSRQVRSEAEHAPALLALGMTRRQLSLIAVIRWLPAALGAAVTAAAVTVAASRLGPFGVARRGPWERSVQADWTVIGIGVVGVAALVLLTAVGTARWQRSGQPAAAVARAVPALFGRPGLRSGVGLAWHSLGRGALPLGSAVVATGLAMAAVVTAAGVVASVRLVIDDSARFGAPWDALLEDTDLPDGTDARTALADIPGVTAGAAIVGTDVTLGDDSAVWTQALYPIDGLDETPPVIVSGRGPADDDEIALGSHTRREAGVEVGDTVSLETPSGERLRFEVVGVTMVTDGFEPNVGHGALVSPEALERIDASALEFAQLAVRFVDGPGRAEALDELRATFPGVIAPFPAPLGLSNAERIGGLPLLLAVGGAVLAAVTLTHALIVSIRRNRGELAICRVLGFTRGQVFTAVATQATLLAAGAVLIGVPLGVAGARWGWKVVSTSFGVTSGPIVPVWVIVGSVAAVLLVANLAAGGPARSAVRLRPSDALRVE